MNPYDCAMALRKIVAEETGCAVSWDQHEEPMTQAELARVTVRALATLLKASGAVARLRIVGLAEDLRAA